ncbi:MAG: glycosyltransferase family 2 protein [Candidatus Amulumruptor caecigallinarius]|nr:glycosyltransferase family 2 protein [Candidatus Amulumruptor caecigallinarius]MCM1396287.1 glycosyltransferase family 2 protein [Candidatus Amulumruptor caecigallinarius]MCM1454281.1 glycosyltransferase family 2 protein [bacterium]
MTGIVILNYNSSTDVAKCLPMLKAQSDAANSIIIVVDNASEQSDKAALEELCKCEGVRMIASAQNRGYNAGNNIGIQAALELGCDAVMIANPDMEFPDKDYVATLRKVLFSSPEYAVAASRIVGPDGHDQNPMRPDGNWTSSLSWIGELFFRRRTNFIDQPAQSHDCHKVSGSCLMLRADFLRSIGMFDPVPFLYCEEAILSKQVEHIRFKMRYDATLTAIHRHIPSAKGDPRPRFRHWCSSRIYFIKHYSGWPLAGRIAATLSMRTYTALLTYGVTFRRLLHR